MHPLLSLALLAAAFAVPFLLPPWPLLAVLAVAVVAVHRWQSPAVRRALRTFVVLSVLLAGLFYALLGSSPADVHLGQVGFAGADLVTGLVSGVRLALVAHVAALGVRVAPPARLLPYLLRGGPVAYVASAMIRLTPMLRDDGERLADAQRARGHRVTARARSWVPLLVPIVVLAMRRAREQSLALSLAGLAPARRRPLSSSDLAVVATFASLAVVGRLSFASLPGVSPSFFLVFLSGVAYGPLVGFSVGVAQRAGSDLAISGLHPVIWFMPFVEGLLGLLSGWLGRLVNLGQRRPEPLPYASTLAAIVGAAYVVVFSVASDSAAWLLARLAFPADAAATLWWTYVAAGLTFNVPSLVFNATLFGVATYPALRALRLSGVLPVRARRTTGAPARPASVASGP